MHQGKYKNQTIKTVQNTAMPGDKFPRILNTKVAFDRTLYQVTKLTCDTKEDGKEDHSDQPMSTRHRAIDHHKDHSHYNG